jgi:hypothetical protein
MRGPCAFARLPCCPARGGTSHAAAAAGDGEALTAAASPLRAAAGGLSPQTSPQPSLSVAHVNAPPAVNVLSLAPVGVWVVLRASRRFLTPATSMATSVGECWGPARTVSWVDAPWVKRGGVVRAAVCVVCVVCACLGMCCAIPTTSQGFIDHQTVCLACWSGYGGTLATWIASDLRTPVAPTPSNSGPSTPQAVRQPTNYPLCSCGTLPDISARQHVGRGAGSAAAAGRIQFSADAAVAWRGVRL